MADKTFTQAEVNNLIARERKRLEHENATITKRISELESQLALAASERDGLAAKLERSDAKLEKLGEAHDVAVSEHRKFRAEVELRRAFVAGNAKSRNELHVLPSAEAHATKLFFELAEVEQDDSGAITSVTYNSRKTKLQDAVWQFLRDHDFMAKASGAPGTGFRRPSDTSHSIAIPAPAPQTLEPKDLIELGWKHEPR